MAFITKDDYEVEIREELLALLDPTEERIKLGIAQKMAISQIRQYLSGRYNMDAVFSTQGEERDMFMVMLTIDCALYHLWSKKAPKKMPEIRAQRYQDALDWLRAAGAGTIDTDLPPVESESESGIIIDSSYKPNQNKY